MDFAGVVQFANELAHHQLTLADEAVYSILDLQIIEEDSRSSSKYNTLWRGSFPVQARVRRRHKQQTFVKEMAVLRHLIPDEGKPSIVDEMFNTPQANIKDSKSAYCVLSFMRTRWFDPAWSDYNEQEFITKLVKLYARPYIVFVKGENKLNLLRRLFNGDNRFVVRGGRFNSNDEFYVTVFRTYTLVFSNIDAVDSIVFGLSNVKPNKSILSLNNMFIRGFVNPPDNAEYALANFRDIPEDRKIDVVCSNPHDGICAVRNVRLICDEWFAYFKIRERIASVYNICKK